MRVSLTLLALAAGAALPACAPVDAPDGQTASVPACFRSRDVDNYRIDTSSRVYVHSRRGGSYALEAAPNCFDASVRAVSVEPFGSTSANICEGDQVRVRLQTTSAVPTTCVATVSGPITDSSVSGLPG